VPNREWLRRDGRDLLLVVGVLALMLGLGISTMSVLAPEPSVVPGDEVGPRARIARDARATPTRVACRCARPTNDPASPLAQPIPRPSVMARRSSGSRDAPDYLVKMTTLLRRRPPSGPTPDPYRASLNPAVYGAGAATPTDHVAGSPPDP
jgi:hypothetical protein